MEFKKHNKEEALQIIKEFLGYNVLRFQRAIFAAQQKLNQYFIGI